MRVNQKFPNWFLSGGTDDKSYTGFISNCVYPYHDSADRPVFSIPYSSAVFPAISYGTKAEVLSSLDVMFAARFGERHLVDWVSKMDLHSASSEAVTSDEKRNSNIIAQMINLRYADKWNHIAEALGIDYDPLENYNRVENSSFNKSGTDDYKDSKSFGQKYDDEGSMSADARKSTKETSGSYKDNDTTTVTEKNGKEKLILEKVSGFDSDDSSAGIEDAPGEPSTFQHIVDKPIADTGYVVEHGGDIKRTYGEAGVPFKEETKEEGSEALSHFGNHGEDGWNYSQISGNIGVTTSQQMLTQELEVRKNVLYDIILSDIADMLCLSIY